MYIPHILSDVKDNIFLSGRNVGASKKLCGNIATISCFVKCNYTDFSEEAKNNYFTASNQARHWLEEQAKKYDVSLSVDGYHIEVDAPNNFNENHSWTILKEFFQKDSMDILQREYETEFNFDETPFLAVFDKHSRSFAYMQKKIYSQHINELSVISKYHGDYGWQTIAHELLHQFGAMDFYFPKKIQEYADYYLGSSIMGNSMQGMDDLTAYLIGWKDTVSYNTYQFLKETMWYTKAEYEKALDEAWKEAF